MRRTVYAFAFLLAFAAAGCSDPETTTVQPRLSVQSTHVDEDGTPLMDFGPYPVLLEKESELVLANVGRAVLEITKIELRDETGMFTIAEAETIAPTSLEGGESMEVKITFRPERQEHFVGSVHIESNDPSKEEAEVRLDGLGSTIGKVEIEPESFDFGVVGEWTQEVANIRIASAGTAPLLIESIELLEESSPAFAVLGSTKPTELPPPEDGLPGGEVVLQVACAPTDAIEEDELSGTLRIRTTDPERRQIDIPLTASVNRAPFAIFEIDPANHAPNLPVELDASASYDPDGDEPLHFEWRVVNLPLGTTAEFDDPNSPTPTLIASHPGTYRIGLDVYDAQGLACRAPEGSQTLPCAMEDLAILSEDDLVITLSWKHALTDLDLHLLDGNSELYSEGDCFWDNRQPDFGILGDPVDDPRFTKESLKGFGPEEVVFSKPSGGTYSVAVEYGKTNGAEDPETEAILRVYVFGSLEAEMSATLTTPGQIWDVLTIEWPAAVVTPIDEIREVAIQ